MLIRYKDLLIAVGVYGYMLASFVASLSIGFAFLYAVAQ